MVFFKSFSGRVTDYVFSFRAGAKHTLRKLEGIERLILY